MENIRLAICDDEKLILPYLSKNINAAFQEHGVKTSISTFQNAQELLASVNQPTIYDVYFLDIELNGANGIKIAETIRIIQPNAILVFISAKEDMVFDTFIVQPFSFIRKSNFDSDLQNTVLRLSQKLAPPGIPSLFITDSLGHVHNLNVNQIIYIKGSDKYVSIVSSNGSMLIRYLMSRIEQDLSGYNFIRIHKSYLVNYKYIHRINKNEVILAGGDSLPISRYRLQEVKRLFFQNF